MLNLAGFFHLNLMYSSIAIDQRPTVIERCYHPLLDLASPDLPLTVEATAITLELINEIDPGWLDKLKTCLDNGTVEFVGSGYSQIIAPLVPASINQANIRLGMKTYEKILGLRPKIWLINEMAYSGGLPGLYVAEGIGALVMEWNNTWKGHPDWDPELRYHWQKAVGNDGSAIPVLWIDTLDFQKFQRMAHDALDVQQWTGAWSEKALKSRNIIRFSTYYGSDAEVFDFRPGRYSHEERQSGSNEWLRIKDALENLAAAEDVKLVTLGSALSEKESEVCGKAITLECTEQPVIVKKQEKYNLNRWAVTGRGDLEANTACHLLMRQLNSSASDNQWRDLLFKWSSDFRTHITEERWADFKTSTIKKSSPGSLKKWDDEISESFEKTERTLKLHTDSADVVLDLRRGLALQSVIFPVFGNKPALGTLPHGHFDDISFGADFYSGHCVVQRPGHRKLTDLQTCAESTTLSRRPDGSLIARVNISDGELTVSKQITIDADAPRITLSGSLALPSRRSGEIHPMHLTIIPGLFQKEGLRFRTHNGGRMVETFPLAETNVHHGASYSTLITAKGGLGATEGIVELGDEKRSLVITHNPSISALIPTVRFQEVRGGDYFLRLRFSAQEIDETFREEDSPWSVQWEIRIEARIT